MFPVSEDNFFREKILDFRDTAAIKQQRRLTITVNPKMLCSHRSSCLGLPVALVNCQMKGWESRLHHVCQGGYVAMHEIELDGLERKICRECIYDLSMGGKFEKSKMMQDSTVYRMDELGEDEEEVEGKVDFDGCDKVNYVPFVYPRGTVSVSSLGSFLSVGSSYKPSHPSLPLSLGAHNIQQCFKRKRGGETKIH